MRKLNLFFLLSMTCTSAFANPVLKLVSKDQSGFCPKEITLAASWSGPSLIKSFVASQFGSLASSALKSTSYGTKAGTGLFSGSFKRQVFRISTDLRPNYPRFVLDNIEITTFISSKAVILKQTRVNYLESAELAEYCPIAKYRRE